MPYRNSGDGINGRILASIVLYPKGARFDVVLVNARYVKNLSGHKTDEVDAEWLMLLHSGYREWDQLEHADEWLLFADNIGPRLAIDETSLFNGELYTFVTNRDARTRDRSSVVVVAGTKAEDVIAVLNRIDEEKRHAVEEVTLDLSDSMRKIVRASFPKSCRVIDRFHIQKLACDAVQELRIKHRWEAIQQANDEMEEARLNDKDYAPFRYPNGDTRKELLIRSRYLLFKSADNWTDRNNGHIYYLNNIQTYRKPTDFATYCV